MNSRFLILSLYIGLLSAHGAAAGARPDADDELFRGFVAPPAQARPFVRWWWNGNRVTADEITRQLDVLQAAGIGGVEINPIALPAESEDVGGRPLVWLSGEWNELLAFAAREAARRGMITDLIVGSGWPFGGEFLSEDQTIQRIIPHEIPYSGGQPIREDEASLVRKAMAARTPRLLQEKTGSREIRFVRLVPDGIRDVSEIIDLTAEYRENGGRIERLAPPGDCKLAYGVFERSVREVMHGAPGAAGPVMNHYDRNVTTAYLDRLKKITEDTGTPLNAIIRALFCDSIELAGANWTDGFDEIFYHEYGYRLEPYYPVVFYDPYKGYIEQWADPGFMDRARRVRHDYNRLLVKTFLDNFTRTFRDFCAANGVLSRYQAYGTPLLMGMLEGNMIPDIPESNNWIYSAPMQSENWEWNQQHGYMVWNLLAASAGHLAAREIISNEAMTNTKGVFKTSLDEIKQHDDMNFISGMNHTVLHGYNYSPAEAGFPGWIRFGTYFSERNSWWPHFPKWVDYNARLSHVFQQSRPVKTIAIVGPQGDVWSNAGLTRVPFHLTPWYCHRLWEPLSQAGSSADYITESILQQGKAGDGTFSFGPMAYEAILLAGVESLDPSTARALRDFAESGGKLIIVDGAPRRSLSMQDAGAGDAVVREVFSDLARNHPDSVFMFEGPKSEAELLSWTLSALARTGIRADVTLERPNQSVYQMRMAAGNRDIYFFTNTNRVKTAIFNADFPTGNKIPWAWNPEAGTRAVYPHDDASNRLEIALQPLQSLLLVFDPDTTGEQDESVRVTPGAEVMEIEGPWRARFDHVDGSTFARSFGRLIDFGTSEDGELGRFAGTVTYSTSFHSDGSGTWLELGKINKGVVEVFINGRPAGVKWYGRPLFPIEGLLERGENRLEIRYVTVLSNYARSLQNNPTAAFWTRGFNQIPMGIEGGARILR